MFQHKDQLLAYYHRNGCFPAQATLKQASRNSHERRGGEEAEAAADAERWPQEVKRALAAARAPPLRLHQWLSGCALFSSMTSLLLALAYRNLM